MTAVLGQSDMIQNYYFFFRLTKSTYTKYMCKKINKMITWVRIFNYCTILPRCTFWTYIWFAHKLVWEVCGSNLNQSRVYKISLESLLHRVQSCGQSEFTSYRSHCPLYLFRLLDPINNQSNRCQNPHFGKSWYFRSNCWLFHWRSEHLFFYHL